MARWSVSTHSWRSGVSQSRCWTRTKDGYSASQCDCQCWGPEFQRPGRSRTRGSVVMRSSYIPLEPLHNPPVAVPPVEGEAVAVLRVHDQLVRLAELLELLGQGERLVFGIGPPVRRAVQDQERGVDLLR